MSNVVELNKPIEYKGTTITITQSSGGYHWRIEKRPTIVFDGDEATREQALEAARLQIDELKGV